MTILNLQPSSTVAIDLKATGVLSAFAHDRAFVASAPSLQLDVGEAGSLDVPVAVALPTASLQPQPDDLKAADRALIMRNLHGKEVLHSERFPTLNFSGRYRGDWETGVLAGDLNVRGRPVPLAFRVQAHRDGDGVTATAKWEGTLTELGIKPFKALLGAIRLKDWARLRLELSFDVAEASASR